MFTAHWGHSTLEHGRIAATTWLASVSILVVHVDTGGHESQPPFTQNWIATTTSERYSRLVTSSKIRIIGPVFRSTGAFAVGAVLLLSIAGCTTTASATSAPTVPASPSAAKPAAGGSQVDPCIVVTPAALDQLTGLAGLASQPIIGTSDNGCHWGTPDGSASVSYDVLPMAGSVDAMISSIQSAAASQSRKITFIKVDLGNGHTGLESVIDGSTAPFASGTVDLFLPPDRYAAIITLLPATSDAASITLNVAKAFSAVADTLPAAPKM